MNVMAMRSSSVITSSGLSNRRAVCCQLSLWPDEEPLLLPPRLDVIELPLFVPPLLVTIVASPSRLLTYSAVGRSFTPKNTWVTLLEQRLVLSVREAFLELANRLEIELKPYSISPVLIHRVVQGLHVAETCGFVQNEMDLVLSCNPPRTTARSRELIHIRSKGDCASTCSGGRTR